MKLLENPLFWIGVADVVLIAGLLLLYPKVARRGLLFGVYVGPENAGSDRAREITRGFYRDVVLGAFVLIFLLAAGVAAAPGSIWGIAPSILLPVYFFWVYLRSYRAAKSLAVGRHGGVAVAPLTVSPAPRTRLPWLAIAVALVLGIWALAYAHSVYDALPDKVPTHFGFSGKPDAWSKKSAASIYLLPAMALGTGLLTGGMAFLVLYAKRGLRVGAVEVSAAAQERFKNAIARMLTGVSILVSTMMAFLGTRSLQVALGERETLGAATNVFVVALLVWTIGGTIWIMVRYGQGGAKLEGEAANAPLADGLADDRYWKLGLFYVNPDDPSIAVEHRFGVGYTVNLGNRWVLAGLGIYLLLIVAVIVSAAQI